ncbi:hypothetical protein [Cyclobacterium sp.]|uniref:hypothetical protein n=1 Tax=Cyclobacterium sp. TaxID=1966343 RepID=UPI00198D6B86|nr:hypothetical protein [Cyclobacterium sp.]MBD3627687.1 hypothetical protein [Cyclobacterium sp.]
MLEAWSFLKGGGVFVRTLSGKHFLREKSSFLMDMSWKVGSGGSSGSQESWVFPVCEGTDIQLLLA